MRSDVAQAAATLTTADPLVSVIVPAYNAQRYVAQAVESALAQTHANLEVIVIDDGSRDATAAIVERLAAANTRIRLVRQPNAGVAAARNAAIALARGELVAPLDADDVWLPHKLERQVARLREAGPDFGVVYGWSAAIDAEGRLLEEGYTYSDREGDVLWALIASNFIGNASVPLVRRDDLRAVGGYDARLRDRRAGGCEDWDIYLRLAERTRFAVVRDFVIGYRQTPESMSSDAAAMGRSYDLVMRALRRRRPEIPASLFRQARASFYTYLAAKSEAARPAAAARWLLRAMVNDRRRLRDRRLRRALKENLLAAARRGLGASQDREPAPAPPTSRPITLDELRAKVQ